MIDKSKTYRTRDGREVRIYATDGGGDHSVHAAIKNPDGWKGVQFQVDVHVMADVVRVRIKREVWVNVYPGGFVHVRYTREDADDDATHDRIACVKLTIDCEEGEGL